MRVGGKDLEARPLVVAEIGANHEGDLGIAKEMIRQAALAGADCVKFQTYQGEKLVARTEQGRLAHFKRLALPREAFLTLSEEAKANHVIFLSTPFDLEAVDFLEPLVPAFKVASGDLTFFPLLEKVAQTGKPIFLSTGMASLDEIRQALEVIRCAAGIDSEALPERVVLLHCVSSYPTEEKEANLLAIPGLRNEFGVKVGYSDHTLGLLACLAACALGACVIEKHFTLDKKGGTFRDHQLSADPKDLLELTTGLKKLWAMLGHGEKIPMPSEQINRVSMRRSLAARVDIQAGRILSWEDLTCLRPGTGIPPASLAKVVGSVALRDIPAGSLIEPSYVGSPKPVRKG